MCHENCCRLCLRKRKSMQPLFEKSGKPDDSLPKMILECMCIEIKKHPGLPAFICDNCKFQLIISLNLRRQCLQIEEILKSEYPHFYNKDHGQRQYVAKKNIKIEVPQVESIPSTFLNEQEQVEIGSFEYVKVEEEVNYEIFFLEEVKESSKPAAPSGTSSGCELNASNSNQPKLRTYMRKRQVKNVPFKCVICAQQFAKLLDLTTHFRIHKDNNETAGNNEERNITLTTNRQPFLNALDITDVQKDFPQTEMASNKPFQCSMCLLKFEYIEMLNVHTQLIHTMQLDKSSDTKYYECQKCRSLFTDFQSLHSHLNGICGRGSINDSYLA